MQIRTLRAPRTLTVLLLAACTGGPTDADDTDTDVDTRDTDGTEETDAVDPGPVELTAFDAATGAPDANEAVLFFGPDGTFLEELQTDSAGKASRALPDGGSVVLMVRFDEDALPYVPVAFMDVRPGDRLTHRGIVPAPTTTTTFEGPDTPSWSVYRISAACGANAFTRTSSSPSGTVAFPACPGSSEFMASGGTSAAGSGVEAVVGATGLVASEGLVAEGPWVSLTPFELTLTDLDADTEGVTAETWHALGAARVPSPTGREGTPSAGRFEVTGSMAAVPGMSVYIYASLSRFGFDAPEYRLRRPYAADLAVSVADVQMPWISGYGFDPATRTVTWTETGAGEIDGLVVSPIVQRGGDSFFWRVGRSEPTSGLVLPLLPEPWTDYNPVTGDMGKTQYLFVRGAGLAEQARRDPVSLVIGPAGGGGPMVDHARMFGELSFN